MCFLVPLLSKVSSKPDGVIVTGSTDNAALHPVTNKNNNRINNFKNLQKVHFMAVIPVVIITKNVYEKQVIKAVYKKLIQLLKIQLKKKKTKILINLFKKHL